MNLGPFQPVEVIKILLVFFLAGYFARNWERLRDLREKRLVPRRCGGSTCRGFSHVLPVMCAVACALALFFLLKDLGPALVTGFLFLAMFGRARPRRIGAARHRAAGGWRHRRIQARQADHGGRSHQHVALALGQRCSRRQSTGAFVVGVLHRRALGSGPGWGDPAMIPAGNTDLVLPAIGEEWGFAGVAAVLLLLGFLVHRRCGSHCTRPMNMECFWRLGWRR